MKLIESLRWRVASLLNRRPDQCWTDLVMWALGTSGKRSPNSPIGWACQSDLARNGECFCGKLRGESVRSAVGES